MKNKVTAADAFYAMHAAVYGEQISEKTPEKYISISESGWFKCNVWTAGMLVVDIM